MNTNKVPSLPHRLYSVWYRHVLVYTRNIVSNGLPPFMDPLIFLAGVGLGLGKYIVSMEDLPYIQFLASGLLVTSSMYTSAFECTYGTFIRLEFDKVYDGMLAAPITTSDLILGEILWAGTKGFFFSFAVLVMISIFGVIPLSTSVFAPLVGFLTGILFGALSLLITSFVKTINHFSFYFTACFHVLFSEWCS
jgi:lipooligosaccharide transport system permease protein